MQPEQTRDTSPRPFSHGEHIRGLEAHANTTRQQEFFHAPYIPSDRFSHVPGSVNYAPDTGYDRMSDNAPSISSNHSFESSSNSSRPQTSFSHMPAPLSNAHTHIPSQNGHFPVPISRGIHDITGQSCPPGGRPRVSTTIWEDEGTLCFQVEAEQVTVARREDNNMINGTKLLNVAQMSRGKRDGILKNESIRHVIKVGSMHLKGVWIPFDRALELANKNHVTDLLYPLFVQDIKKFLYHPANYARTAAVLAAATHRQALQTQPDAISDHRPALDRSTSMPTPLDRSLSMLTPPSSASTNGDYWTVAANNANIPISDAHARSHSLPGTPATTPPAPAYVANGVHNQSHFAASFTEPRAHLGGNRYGQQPDMQRSYQHSRNTSLMSYQEEEASTASSGHSGQPVDQFGVLSMPPAKQFDHARLTGQHNYNSMNDRQYQFQPQQPQYYNPIARSDQARNGTATPNHQRTHSRNQSRGKVFNTPNLTTQLTKRPQSHRTPTGSPAGHARQQSADVSTQASLWVQQQQQLAYSTPQQPARSNNTSTTMPSQLPQIFEETPSCRMAYQLHGQTRAQEQYPRFVHNEQGYNNPQQMNSLQKPQMESEMTNSPLSGKKRRERVTSDTQNYYSGDMAQDERQESLTPPPVQRVDYEDSPKRRRSVRTGTHSRSGSVFDY